ncbi:MADS-box transcription factor 25-like protein [Carex littledalei]|uniref:MADS-box transcription factor 25-like protein n=1 Tax=Carex littledalei TaxID=544730 RepID=A0A833RHB6_9POAL|nr:MADS-box transcription factor 25-like protein [Carex littledalei]
MGLNKIEIKTKETLYERKETYGKRRKGLLNKAKELSVMCDVPLMLLFFSPSTEKPPHIFLGDQCNLQQMIERYAAVPLQERYQRKLEDFQQLKKLLAKQGIKIDAKYEQMCQLSGSSGQSELEDKQNHLSVLQAEINEVEKALGSLSYLSDIDSIDDTNMLEEMERALQMHIHTLKISSGNPILFRWIIQRKETFLGNLTSAGLSSGNATFAGDIGSDGHTRAMMEQATVPQDWEAVSSEESTQIGVNPYPPAPVFEVPELEQDLLYTSLEGKNYWEPPPTADHKQDPHYQDKDKTDTTCEEFPENPDWMDDYLYDQQTEEAQRQYSLLEALAQYHYPPAAPGDPGASSSQPPHAM